MNTSLGRRRARTPILPRITASVALVVATVAVAFPLFLMVYASFRPQDELLADPIGLPKTLTLENYARAWSNGAIAQNTLNSLLVALCTVLLTTTAGAGVGYAAARSSSRLVRWGLTSLFALGLLLPIQSGIVPSFVEMQSLGILGTIIPMVLLETAMSLPIAVLLFSGFFAALPKDVEESAALDGASTIRVLFAIVIPMSLPVIMTNAILSLVATWNDFFVPLVFATDPSVRTLPLGLSAFKLAHSTDWGAMLAFSVLIAFPLFALYVWLQRYIISGVSMGAGRET